MNVPFGPRALTAERMAYQEEIAGLQHVVATLNQDIAGHKYTIQVLKAEVDALRDALKTKYHVIDIDNPLFEGLVDGSLDTRVLLKTLHHAKKVRDTYKQAAREMYEDTFKHVPAGAWWLEKYPWLK